MIIYSAVPSIIEIGTEIELPEIRETVVENIEVEVYSSKDSHVGPFISIFVR